MQVLTTTTFVLQTLRNKMKASHPEYYFTYSPELDYKSAEEAERANSSDITISNSSLPLVPFNRSPMRNTVLGSRGVRFSAYQNLPSNNPNQTTTKYRTAHLEFDLNFSVIDKDINTIEDFEIEYLSKEGFGRITEFEVDFTAASLGLLKYYVNWNPTLVNFVQNIDSNSYCSITGTATVWGYFVSLYGEIPIINNIKVQIENNLKEIYDSFVISE